jgi:sugar lactone lactonase YvrE
LGFSTNIIKNHLWKEIMKLLSSRLLALAIALGVAGCAAPQLSSPVVSILVDLDPLSAERTVIVENITANREGILFTSDRVTGNILRIDPKSPKPVVVGKIESRTVDGKKVDPSPGGISFDANGDLYLAAGPFSEVVRIKAADLNPAKPGTAQTFTTGVPGANGIAFDKRGHLFVSGGASGIIYSVGPTGGAAQATAQIDKYVRTLPNSTATQAIVANGLKFDAAGVLHVADTSRGAVWKVAIGADGKGGKPALLAQSALLEGADDMAFNSNGDVWMAANELNAIVSISPSGVVKTIAKNGGKGPLEFPAALVFVGKTAYIANFDVPRRDNIDANGTTAKDGIGASIAQIAQ